MAFGINRPQPIDDFERQMEALFGGIGMQYSMKPMGAEADPFFRVSMRPRGTQISPLTLDISPGPAVGEWGHAVNIRSQRSGKHAIMGAEMTYGMENVPSTATQPGWKFHTPLQNLGRYISAAAEIGRESHTLGGESMQEGFWRGMTTGVPERLIGGSVVRSGSEPDFPGTTQDVAKWVGLTFGPSVRDTKSALTDISNIIASPPGGTEMERLLAPLRGYAPFSETSGVSGLSVTRMKPVSIPLGGQDVLGIGTSAADIMKRRSSTMGFAGTREQAFLYDVGADPSRLVEKTPQYITDPTQRGGYRFSNILYPGETEPRATVVRPGTVFRGGSLFPGAFTQYQDPYAGSQMVGYKSKEDVNLPSQNIPSFAVEGAKFQWGMGWKEGAPSSPLAGGVVKAGQSIKIGQYTLPAQEPGATPISEDIYYRAGGRAVHFRGEPKLHFPMAYHTSGEFAGMGHSGVTPQGRLPAHVSTLSPSQRGAIEQAAGGQVDFTSQQAAFFTIPTAIETGTSVKGAGGVKAGPFTPGGLEQIPQEMLNVTTASGRVIPIGGATGGLKADLPSFIGMFGSLTNPQQHRLVQQVYGGAESSSLAGFIQSRMEGTDRPAAAISMEGLAQAQYTGAGGEGVMPAEHTMMFWEQFRRGFWGKLSPGQQAEYGEQYLGSRFGEPWLATKGELRSLRTEAMGVYTGGRPRSEVTMQEALAARRQFREHIQVSRPEQGPGRIIQSLSESRIGTLAHTLVPEFFASKPTKFGIDERAAISSRYPEVAKFMGIHAEMDPYASGYRPPHVQAWDAISEVSGYNELGRQWNIKDEIGEQVPTGGTPPRMPQSVELTPERQDALTAAIAGGASLKELGGLTRSWGQGPLYRGDLPPGSQYMDQPGTILGVSQFEYGQEGGEAINRISRLYSGALKSFASGSEEGLQSLQFARERAVKSRAGTVTKGRVSSYLAQGFGGRYSQVTGVEPGTAIIDEQRLLNVFKQMASAKDLPLTAQRESDWMAQVKGQMRTGTFAGVGVRYPVLGQETGAMIQNMVTPDVAEELFGISQARASKIARSGALIPGDIASSFSLRASGTFYKPMVGDVDIDPLSAFPVMRVGADEDLEFAGAQEIQEMLGPSDIQRVSRENAVLSGMMGEEGSSQFNEVANAIRSLGDPLKGMGQSGTFRGAGGDVFAAGVAGMRSKQGMGVSFNMRRLITAAAESQGFGAKTVARGHTGGALGYQRYLDAVANASQGFSMTETLMQSLYMNERANRPVMGAILGKTSAGKENWVQLGQYSADPETQAMYTNRFFGSAMRTAISSDIEAGHMTPRQAGLLLGQPGVVDPLEAEELIGGAGRSGAGITEAIRGLEGREGFDWTGTNVGLAAISEMARKIQTRTQKDPAGATIKTLDKISGLGMTVGGTQYQIGQLAQAGPIASTLALRKQYYGREGTLLPTEVEAVHRQLSSVAGGRPVSDMATPLAAQIVQSAYGSGAVTSIQEARQANERQWFTKDRLALPTSGEADLPRDIDASYASIGGTPVLRRARGGSIHQYTGQEGGAVGGGAGGAGMGGSGGGIGTTAPDPGGADWMRRLVEQGIDLRFQAVGLSKLPEKSEQIYASGVSAYRRMFGQIAGGGGSFLDPAIGATQGLMAKVHGKAFGPDWFKELGLMGQEVGRYEMQEKISQMAQMDPRGFRQLLREHGTEIQAGARGVSAIQKAAQEYFKHPQALSTYAQDISEATDVSHGLISSTSAGLGARGIDARILQTLKDVGTEQGLFGKGAAAVPTDIESQRIATTSKGFHESLKKFTEHLEKSTEAIGKETISRKESIKLQEEQKQVQLADLARQRSLLAPEISTRQEQLARRIEAGATDEDLAGLRGELGDLYAKRGTLAQREFGLTQARGRTPGEVLKSLTGGWNVMYMTRMAQLGMSQFQQGYAESEQYLGQTSLMARRMFGGEIEGRVSPEMQYQRALLRGSSGVASGLRQLSAGAAGTPLSDFAGAGLTGLGAMSLASFVGGQLATGTGAIGAFGSGLAAAALPIGIAAAGVGLGAAQYGYWQESDQAALQVASMPSGNIFEQGMKDFSSAWKLQFKTEHMLDQGAAWKETPRGLAAQYESWFAQTQGLPGGTDRDRLVADSSQRYGYKKVTEHLAPFDMSGLSAVEKANLAKMAGMDPDFAPALPSALASELHLVGGEAGMWGEDFEQTIEEIGVARMAGLPGQAISQLSTQVSGQGMLSSAEMLKLEAQYRDMPGDEGTKMLAGMTLMAKTPGILGITQGAPQRWIDKMAAGPFADIEGGRWEESFLQRSALRAGKRAVGVDVPELDYDAFDRDITKTVQEQAQDFAEISLGQQTLGIQQQLAGMGISQFNQAIEGFDFGQVQGLQSAMAFKQNTLTQMAQQDMLGDEFAMGDINLQGQLTGLGWGTTSLQAGATPGTEMAARIFGAGWEDQGAAQGAVFGVQDPTGQMVGGTRGLSWALKYAQRGYQSDQMDLQRSRIGVSSYYAHKMWEVQDEQRALSHRQSQWGFEFQQRQFDMSGEQFAERSGLSRREQLMRREWGQEDFATNQAVSAMQWGWKTEDFEENVRFMSGRQRKIAERGMERATVMRGLAVDQEDKEKERMEEMNRMADEQYNMQMDHHRENRDLIEENMEKQKEFYEEGRKLQDELIKLQRAQFDAQQGLALRQIELQEEHTATVEELQDAMTLINQEEQDRTAEFRKMIELNPAKMMERIVAAFIALQAAIGETPARLGGDIPHAVGGDVIPGVTYLTGEFEPELVRSGTIGSVATLGDLRTAERLYHDRWDDSSSFSSPNRGSGNGQQSISIYIGEKKIKEFIIDTISKELKVH